MKKFRFSKGLVALGLGAMVMTGLKAPVSSKAAYPGSWGWDGSGWTYTFHDNTGYTWEMKTGLRKIDGKPYAFKDGHLITGGWAQLYGSNSYWVYADADGELATGWQTIGGVTYYFYASGRMAADTTIDGKYYVDANGAYQGQGEWKKDGDRWWYAYANPKKYSDYNEATGEYTYRNYPKNTTAVIDGISYAFDENGYMMTGWIHDVYNNGDGDWFYADASGKLAAGWKQIDGTWYYFSPYFGYMYTYCKVDEYVLGGDGTIVETLPGWKQDANGWWYELENGERVVGEYCIDKEMYCFGKDGYMLTGWVDLNTFYNTDAETPDWHYYEEDGSAISFGWHEINGTWYYFPWNDGEMAVNSSWVGYSFDENGAYTKNVDMSGWTWKTDGARWWYEDEKGSYKSSVITSINGFNYAFDASGYMMTGWVKNSQISDYSYSTWYYFESDGRGANGWKKLDGLWYYFDAGKMLKNTYIDGCYLNNEGVWEEDPGYAIDSMW